MSAVTTGFAMESGTVVDSDQTASGASDVRARYMAIGFSLITVLLVLSPIVQNWQPEPVDNFPLSYYPMFSTERSGLQRLTYLVGLDGQGRRVPIPYTLAGTGGMNQVRRQIDKLVNRNEAAQLCHLVSLRLGQRRTGAMSRIASVKIVTGTYDLAQYFSGNKRPVSERDRATCLVAR
ncbi:MAG: hypothetical protein ACKVVP_05350 [Chloroflexota bacterium]